MMTGLSTSAANDASPGVRTGAPLLALRGVTRQYGEVAAVQDVSLDVHTGETAALLGPSGCGKSTLLRVIAGLERPDAGDVLLSGRDATRLPPERRDLSLVFQDYALFPHLNVLQNVMYGPRARGQTAAVARARALEVLDLVGLADLARRRVSELSGGQQQRVALARALAPAPGLLLLDEPLSNLDERLRAELQDELRGLFARLNTTVLLVTHDQREALALASRVILMRDGRVLQDGPAGDVHDRPATAWAAAFLGHTNLLPHPQGRLLVPDRAVRLGTGEAHEVLDARPDGHGVRVRVRHALGVLTLSLSAREADGLGRHLHLTVDARRLRVLPDDLGPDGSNAGPEVPPGRP